MTTYNKATLKTFFEQGDVPTGTDYANLIDSQVNLVETSEQSMAGALKTTEVVTPRVSASNINITGVVSAVDVRISTSASIGGVPVLTTTGALPVSNKTITNSSINNSSVGLTTPTTGRFTTVSAATVYADKIIQPVGVVSAAGTTQGTAASLTNVINRGKGINDGSTTGFTPLANQVGLVQYLFNEGVSANLWPPVGGFINGLAANTAFPLATSAMVTIVHLTTSAYAVK